jgi:hypothetical protein
VYGDQPLWWFLRKVLVFVYLLWDMFNGKLDIIFTIAVNSVVWGLIIALPVNAVVMKFQKRANLTALDN